LFEKLYAGGRRLGVLREYAFLGKGRLGIDPAYLPSSSLARHASYIAAKKISLCINRDAAEKI
jgi:hypothetical protein